MADRHTVTPYPLRLTPDLKRRVEESARENGRSFNSEVAMRLEQTFNYDVTEEAMSRGPDGYRAMQLDIDSRFREMEKMMHRLEEAGLLPRQADAQIPEIRAIMENNQ